MVNTLYIVGNGFDLHHGIPSSYGDFGKYLKKVDPVTYREVETYFTVDDEFWWEFEARLADFDVDTLIDYASMFLVSYGAEDWSDASHHDYQYELDKVVKAISQTMRNHFANWVRQLPIPNLSALSSQKVNLDPSAIYLTFNYTDTLQKTYGIAKEQIVHIHGRAFRAEDRLVLGHGWERSSSDSLNHNIDSEEADTRVLEGNQIVDDYFSSTFKPTNEIIVQHERFFQSLSGIRKVLVAGHSLSEVDAPYIDRILHSIDQQTVTWTVSYHGSPYDIQQRVSGLGIAPALVTYAPLSSF